MRTPEVDPVHHNVVLTGFMGTGKTTTGLLLAGLLDMEFVDTDQIIETRYGPIQDIFAAQGESAFRDIERKVANELSGRSGLVISTGGRMMLDPVNVEFLTKRGTVFCLVAPPEEIFERIAAGPDGTERPLLAGPDPMERIVELLGERAEGYGRFRQVATSKRSPEEVAQELAAMFSSTAD